MSEKTKRNPEILRKNIDEPKYQLQMALATSIIDDLFQIRFDDRSRDQLSRIASLRAQVNEVLSGQWPNLWDSVGLDLAKSSPRDKVAGDWFEALVNSGDTEKCLSLLPQVNLPPNEIENVYEAISKKHMADGNFDSAIQWADKITEQNYRFSLLLDIADAVGSENTTQLGEVINKINESWEVVASSTDGERLVSHLVKWAKTESKLGMLESASKRLDTARGIAKLLPEIDSDYNGFTTPRQTNLLHIAQSYAKIGGWDESINVFEESQVGSERKNSFEDNVLKYSHEWGQVDTDVLIKKWSDWEKQKNKSEFSKPTCDGYISVTELLIESGRIDDAKKWWDFAKKSKSVKKSISENKRHYETISLCHISLQVGDVETYTKLMTDERYYDNKDIGYIQIRKRIIQLQYYYEVGEVHKSNDGLVEVWQRNLDVKNGIYNSDQLETAGLILNEFIKRGQIEQSLKCFDELQKIYEDQRLSDTRVVSDLMEIKMKIFGEYFGKMSDIKFDYRQMGREIINKGWGIDNTDLYLLFIQNSEDFDEFISGMNPETSKVVKMIASKMYQDYSIKVSVGSLEGEHWIQNQLEQTLFADSHTKQLLFEMSLYYISHWGSDDSRQMLIDVFEYGLQNNNNNDIQFNLYQLGLAIADEDILGGNSALLNSFSKNVFTYEQVISLSQQLAKNNYLEDDFVRLLQSDDFSQLPPDKKQLVYMDIVLLQSQGLFPDRDLLEWSININSQRIVSDDEKLEMLRNQARSTVEAFEHIFIDQISSWGQSDFPDDGIRCLIGSFLGELFIITQNRQTSPVPVGGHEQIISSWQGVRNGLNDSNIVANVMNTPSNRDALALNKYLRGFLKIENGELIFEADTGFSQSSQNARNLLLPHVREVLRKNEILIQREIPDVEYIEKTRNDQLKAYIAREVKIIRDNLGDIDAGKYENLCKMFILERQQTDEALNTYRENKKLAEFKMYQDLAIYYRKQDRDRKKDRLSK